MNLSQGTPGEGEQSPALFLAQGAGVQKKGEAYT